MITFKNVSKAYKNHHALSDINFAVQPGSIVGLFGPNGAGKTTLINALLGMIKVEGSIEVLGLEPFSQRHKLMESVAYIADVATLPRWITAEKVVELFEGVYPKFNREKALRLIATTSVPLNKAVKHLSKGMIAQLHLSCILAIEVPLLVLDEPTLGLDILYRKQFYDMLITEFYDDDRCIIVTSHQIDELEQILNNVVILSQGKMVLHETMDNIAEKYVAVKVDDSNLEAARKLNPLTESKGLGRTTCIYHGHSHETLAPYGPLSIPSLSDIFVATV